jgi:CheY-like chemotaxis protein
MPAPARCGCACNITGLRLFIRDNGRGARSPPPGVGLHSMAERARSLGGELHFQPPGAGWALALNMPWRCDEYLLVDDHAVVRQGYASLLRAVLPAMEVREAASGEEALARVQEAVPNLVIMDFGLPGISGLETTRRLRQRLPQLRVLFFSMHDELPLVRQALDAGASGYLTKSSARRC